MPPATAAAIESASSLGGQLMPPVMGVAAFLMAEFLGKSYFEVVARCYVPALIYCAVCETNREIESSTSFSCAACGTPSAQVVQGREIEVFALELSE